ncbi:MAG: hypothetical protein AAGF83_00100 [Cyanobacteria bacterium P01_G01_bin.67]
MALVCDELKFIYFLAPGTGSSALYKYFQDNFDVKKIPDSDENIVAEDGKVVVRSKHSTLAELKENNLLNSEQLNYLKITGTRNPYDYFYAEWYRSRTRFSKLLADESSWVYRTPKGKKRIAEIVDSIILEFPDWIEKRLKNRYESKQKAMLHPEYVYHSDAFIRMENMNEDIHNILLNHCGVDKKIEVPKKNVTNRDRCYWQHYSLSARNMVKTVFKPYINKFDYSF